MWGKSLLLLFGTLQSNKKRGGEMSRLTDPENRACFYCDRLKECDWDNTYDDCITVKYYDKLQHYEDLEEQGYKMIDVESVVEQLKNEKEIVKSLITPRGGKSFYEGALRGLNKALKIVRGEVK